MLVYGEGDIIKRQYRVKCLLRESPFLRLYQVENCNGFRQSKLRVPRDPEEMPDDCENIYEQYLKDLQFYSTLEHPYLPVVEEAFTLNGKLHIVEEIIEGDSIAEYARQNPPAESDLFNWLIKLCEVMELLHNNHIIFRNLTPEKILITRKGSLRLVDFEFNLFGPGDKILLGTPGYAAPELYGSNVATERTDIYSIGSILYQLLTGEDPHSEDVVSQLAEDFRLPVKRELLKVADIAMRAKPDERFNTVEKLRKVITNFYGTLSDRVDLEDGPSSMPPPVASAEKKPARGPSCAAIMIITLLGLGRFIFYLVFRG